MEEDEDIYCPQCDTKCAYAPAIGHYCPNKNCDVRDNLEGIKYNDFYFALESFQVEAESTEFLWTELNMMKVALSRLEKQAITVKTEHDAKNFVESFKKFADLYIEDKWRP